MAGSVNKVILVGNLGRDPEVRSFQNGGRVCNLSVATSESWKDKTSGERKEKTEWHRVVVYNENIIGVAERYLKKGAKVYIEGQLETRKYTDKDGTEKYSTEVTLRQFRGELTMLDSAGGERSSVPANDATSGYDEFSGGGAKAVARGGAAPELNDEIPF
ncbi:MAG: single-stranded DNA-binding protein [Hyphomicrobium sp.]